MARVQKPAKTSAAGGMATTKGARLPRYEGRARKASRRRAAASMQPKSAAVILAGIRQRLEIAQAVAIVTVAALKFQSSDSDEDAATALQRCVADEIDRQLEQLDAVIAACRALGRKSVQGRGPS